MDPELLEIIRKVAAGRSFTMLRHVGNRVEVHFSGDYEPTILKFGKEKKEVPLSKMKLAELRDLASELEITTYGKKKSELIAAIKAIREGTDL